MFDHVDRFSSLGGKLVIKLGAVAVIIMMVAILVQVIASRVGVTTILDINGAWPVFGPAVTLNSLTDLQWYLLAAVALLPAGVVWLRGVHVRVDFAYSAMRPRGKAAVDLAGHAIFALPFLVLMIPDAWELAARAFARGEASPNGGLTDRFLPRGVIPIGFGLLLAAILFETWLILRNWKRTDD
ncbi:MAG: TRAP transporter small permease subunit [Pseudomonadota bacterium]